MSANMNADAYHESHHEREQAGQLPFPPVRLSVPMVDTHSFVYLCVFRYISIRMSSGADTQAFMASLENGPVSCILVTLRERLAAKEITLTDHLAFQRS